MMSYRPIRCVCSERFLRYTYLIDARIYTFICTYYTRNVYCIHGQPWIVSYLYSYPCTRRNTRIVVFRVKAYFGFVLHICILYISIVAYIGRYCAHLPHVHANIGINVPHTRGGALLCITYRSSDRFLNY